MTIPLQDHISLGGTRVFSALLVSLGCAALAFLQGGFSILPSELNLFKTLNPFYMFPGSDSSLAGYLVACIMLGAGAAAAAAAALSVSLSFNLRQVAKVSKSQLYPSQRS